MLQRYKNPFADMPKRHEIKVLLSYHQYVELRARVAGVMTPDPHMPGPEGYRIQSVYLDDIFDSAYHEKGSGVQHRNKFRIRAYNGDSSYLVLENKEKIDDYISKSSAVVSKETYDSILQGDFSGLLQYDDPLCHKVLALRNTQGLHPVVMVEYMREAFVHPLSMVRVTFDREVSAGINTLDMFSEKLITRPIYDHGQVVLEIKYGKYFPMYLKQLLQNNGTRMAISKFVLGCDLLKKNYITLQGVCDV